MQQLKHSSALHVLAWGQVRLAAMPEMQRCPTTPRCYRAGMGAPAHWPRCAQSQAAAPAPTAPACPALRSHPWPVHGNNHYFRPQCAWAHAVHCLCLGQMHNVHLASIPAPNVLHVRALQVPGSTPPVPVRVAANEPGWSSTVQVSLSGAPVRHKVQALAAALVALARGRGHQPQRSLIGRAVDAGGQAALLRVAITQISKPKRLISRQDCRV